jgi:hypothetical protein
MAQGDTREGSKLTDMRKRMDSFLNHFDWNVQRQNGSHGMCVYIIIFFPKSTPPS